MMQQKQTGILEELFGGVTAKVLDFLSVYRDWDYSKQDIAKNSGVSLRHAILSIEKLETKGILKHTRNVGNSQMYQFNTENETAMMLQKFALTLAYDECKKIGEQELQEEQEQAKHEITLAYEIKNPMIPQTVTPF
jgi:transposase